MKLHVSFHCVVAMTGAFLALGWQGAALAQEKGARLELDERWSNVESGKEWTIRVRVAAPAAFVGRLNWAVSMGTAPIARGEAAVELSAGQSKVVAVKVPGQSVRPGVILEAVFAATIVRDKENQPTARMGRSFWILSADPLAERREWAKGLKAVLYDPKGTTAETLTKAQFPFEEQRNLAALAEIKEGVVILGEGLSWREEAGLGDIAWKLAERGVRVLCLAPLEGDIAIPGLGKKASKSVSRFTLRKADVITGWDKRLDAEYWHGNASSILSRIGFRGDGEDIVGEALRAGDGWPWVDVRFDSGGVLAVCGFGVIRHWDAGPTPRFVFLRALESPLDKK
jgi:hypothetical protein